MNQRIFSGFIYILKSDISTKAQFTKCYCTMTIHHHKAHIYTLPFNCVRPFNPHTYMYTIQIYLLLIHFLTQRTQFYQLQECLCIYLYIIYTIMWLSTQINAYNIIENCGFHTNNTSKKYIYMKNRKKIIPYFFDRS